MRIAILLLLALPAWASTGNGHFLIDIGSLTPPGTGWNGYANVDLTNMVDSTNTATTVGLTATTLFTTAGSSGTTTCTVYAYPTSTCQNYLYAPYASPSPVIAINNLDNAKTYTFRFHCSRMGTGTVRLTNYTIGSTTVSLECTDNVDNTVSIAGAVPSSGSVTFTVSPGTGNTAYVYLNVLEITEQTPATGSVKRRVIQ